MAFSAGRHLAANGPGGAPGWWSDQVGPGLALDQGSYQLVSMDYLAGPGESASAEELQVGPGGALPPARQADALAEALDALGIERLHALVGASYGGMVGLSFAQRHPARLDRLVVLCAAHQTHPMATALRSLQRRVVRLGRDTGREREALSLARGIAMTTYRTDREFAERFDGSPSWTESGPRFPVDGYLEAQGAAFAESFDAEEFLTISESLDLHRVDPAAIETPTWLLASRFDTLVPLWQVWELAAALGGPVSQTILPSRFGHDAFLKEVGPVDRFLRVALHGPDLPDTHSQGEER